MPYDPLPGRMWCSFFEITAEEIITPLIKENATARKAVAFMVAGGGFEPPTFGS